MTTQAIIKCSIFEAALGWICKGFEASAAVFVTAAIIGQAGKAAGWWQ
jgi:hypothetical protein